MGKCALGVSLGLIFPGINIKFPTLGGWVFCPMLLGGSVGSSIRMDIAILRFEYYSPKCFGARLFVTTRLLQYLTPLGV